MSVLITKMQAQATASPSRLSTRHRNPAGAITQPVTVETLTKARQRRKRDDNLKVTLSSARFLLKLIEGEAKDEATGICFVHATATGTVNLKEIL